MPHRLAAVDETWRSVRAASPATTAGPEHARITFLGHATLLIEVDDLRILTDPVLRDGVGPIRRQVKAVLPELFADLDAVFISHGHHDHLDIPSLRQIPGRPTVIAPKGFAGLLGKVDLGPVEEVEPGDRLTIDRVHFTVVDALHSGRREPFGPEGPPIGCIIEGSRTIYFPGDTDIFPAMAEWTGTLDAALLPVWGWGPNIGPGHMDPERAAQAAAILDPEVAIPIHWGTFYPALLRTVVPKPFERPGRLFAEAAARIAPGVPVRVLAPGESIDLARRRGDRGSPGHG